ncbi:MAG: hypothetical protein ACPG8W_12725 [Candidatus Promineifilaceae bacterium]
MGSLVGVGLGQLYLSLDALYSLLPHLPKKSSVQDTFLLIDEYGYDALPIPMQMQWVWWFQHYQARLSLTWIPRLAWLFVYVISLIGPIIWLQLNVDLFFGRF